MTICLLKNVDLKWIPLLLDPALVGSVATTSGSSEIGVVGRERESKKGTERGLVAAPTTVCRWGNVAGAATGVQTAWARRGDRRSTGEGGGGEINTLRSPPPGVHG